jgi:hypothetical protein
VLHEHNPVVYLDIRFGSVDVEDEFFLVDERSAPLGAVTRAGSTFIYRYDFGDCWEHEVKAERVTEGGDEPGGRGSRSQGGGAMGGLGWVVGRAQGARSTS